MSEQYKAWTEMRARERGLGVHQLALLRFLRECHPEALGPTALGELLGPDGCDATWASPKLLGLAERGLVVRQPGGKYRAALPGEGSLNTGATAAKDRYTEQGGR